MRVTPKRWLHNGKLQFDATRNHYYLECEAIHPPSAKGKTVTVFLTQEDVTDLIKELRQVAIEARS